MVIAENYGLELYDNSLFLFCGSRTIGSKGYFGTVKALFYSISVLRMVIWAGQDIVVKLKSYQLGNWIGYWKD